MDVKQVFLEVLQKNISFEEASNWATEVIKKDELGELECSANDNRSTIFMGLTYLTGLDLEESPGEYLHSLENVQEKFNKLF